MIFECSLTLYFSLQHDPDTTLQYAISLTVENLEYGRVRRGGQYHKESLLKMVQSNLNCFVGVTNGGGFGNNNVII